jgi:hypothetical protein
MNDINNFISLKPNNSCKIVALFLFLGIFVTTFNSAYMSGDDFVSIAGIIWRDVYIPSFSKTWIPNRVFDPYGQALFTLLLDSLYHPLHLITGISIFWTHKILASLLFATFVTTIYVYIGKKLASFRDPNESRTLDLLTNIAIALALASVLPWKNHTHIISYEIPAFLTFVLFLELSEFLIQDAGKKAIESNDFSRSSSFYIVLIYIIAFTLEAYSLILALAFLLLILINFILKLISISKLRPLVFKKEYFIYMAWFFALTAYSLSLILIFFTHLLF